MNFQIITLDCKKWRVKRRICIKLKAGDMRACTGKPAELGGIPHELGTTGYGVASALEAAVEILEKLKQSRILDFWKNKR
jgi:glutamate dehydrogenase/leucine dehydrogenase